MTVGGLADRATALTKKGKVEREEERREKYE